MIAKLAELKRLTPIEYKSIAEDALSDISVWLTKEKISMLKGFVEQQLMPQYRELYSYLNYNYQVIQYRPGNK